MKIKGRISAFLVIMMLISSMTFSVFAQEIDAEKLTDDIQFLTMVIQFVMDGYQYEVKEEDIINGLYDGFFGVLDDYSVHFTPEEFAEFTTTIDGEFVGIGVNVIEKNGYITIISPLPNSPAMRAGLKSDDAFVSVDGHDVKGLPSSAVSKLLKGEKGTSTKIVVLRNGAELTFDVIRDTIVVSSCEGHIMENNIGYLNISGFNDNTPQLVENELKKFDDKNVEKIVIDIRNNPGGSITSVVKILNMFVTKGPILYVENANGEEEIHESILEKQKYEIAVLVNDGSASASEVFAGAVKDKKEGIIIGTTTYGKGVVQTLYPLVDDSAVKFTTAEYFTAGRNKVQGIGITPDIIVENKTIDYDKLPDFDEESNDKEGDVSLNVLAAEMILDAMNYKVNTPDGIFDKSTLTELRAFQQEKNLSITGTIDKVTQEALVKAILQYVIPENLDLQLKAAIDAIK